MTHACLHIGPAGGPTVVGMAATPAKLWMFEPPAEFQILIGLASFVWFWLPLTLFDSNRHV